MKSPAVGIAAAALVFALAFTACQRRSTTDLAATLAGAEIARETAFIDIGTPAARDHLTRGWGSDEKWGDASFAWALGDRSSVDFFTAAPRPFTLRMRCWPLPIPHLPTQTVEVALNGVALGSLSLQPKPADYSLAVPAAALHPGINALDFHYAYARRPVDLDPTSSDPRPLAVAWDWLKLDGLAESDAPALLEGPDGRALLLPPRSQVGFYLDLPAGGILQVDDVVASPEGKSTALEIAARTDGADGEQAMRVDVQGRSGARRWTLNTRGLTRLTFRAGAGASALRVVAPRVTRTQRVAAARCDAPAPAAGSARPPVLLFLIDTLRSDHLGCYGYPRPTTPRIDAFARDAVRYSHAVAQASWTKPAVASIFTGLTPHRHGATGRRDVLRQATTLAGTLAAAGYETSGIVTNTVVSAAFGFAQGFDDYRLLEERPLVQERQVDAPPRALIHQGADVLRRAALEWLDARTAQRPFFLYLHATDPHDPYIAPEAFRQRWAPGVDPELGMVSTLHEILTGRRRLSESERESFIGLYDAEIAFADQEFGALLDDLRARGLYDDALVILIGDHGEAFAEHDRWHHGTTLFQEEIHVPLLIKFPHRWHGGTVVDGLAQDVDVLPTVLTSLGLAVPPGGDGHSLLPAIACPEEARDSAPAYSHLGGQGFGVELESIIVGGRRKLIHYAVTDRPHPRTELFDLVDDPEELHDLAAAHPVESGYLLSLMASFRSSPGSAPRATPAALDPAAEERLRLLGYGP